MMIGAPNPLKADHGNDGTAGPEEAVSWNERDAASDIERLRLVFVRARTTSGAS